MHVHGAEIIWDGQHEWIMWRF